MYAPSVYTYIINGVPGVYSAQASFNASKGPCAVIYNDGKIKSFSSLTGKSVSSLSAFSATMSGKLEMKLSGDVQVYIRDGDEYYLSSMANIGLDTHELMAYYDEETENGGCIRIIVARER